MLKKILFLILTICMLSITSFAGSQPEAEKEKSVPKVQHIKIIETDGIFFLLCVDGQEFLVIIHSGGAAAVQVPVKCDCGNNL